MRRRSPDSCALPSRLKISGFNNVAAMLRLSAYRLGYCPGSAARAAFHSGLDDEYAAAALAQKLRDTARTIGAQVLNVSAWAYEPRGASSVLLAGEAADGPAGGSVAVHLDKSHLAAHTYPDTGDGLVQFFRVDVDLSTCGNVAPLDHLESVLSLWPCDLVEIDASVRGFTRDATQGRHYGDLSGFVPALERLEAAGFHRLREGAGERSRFACVAKELDPRLVLPATIAVESQEGTKALKSLQEARAQVAAGQR